MRSLLEKLETKPTFFTFQVMTHISEFREACNELRNWVKEGTTEFNKKPIEHNVSCTVIVKSEEWSDVIDYLYNIFIIR